ncbi:MAG: rod shape-determining protein RodA [Dongiaceae bacterium]
MAAFRQVELSIAEKLQQISVGLVLLIVAIGCVGFVMLYSANKSLEPWALRQIIRFAVGLAIMLGVVLVDMRVWLKHAYSIYAITFLLLLYVEFAGEIGMGAQRWIDLKFIQLQPSELMKVALVLALARFFHRLASDDIGRPASLIVPILLVLAPTGLVLAQPDLGTATMLLMVGAAIFFVAGVRMWKFAVVAVAALAALPIAWDHLRDYQKDRILTFLNPENDPQGAGYHILQSMIAFGSGGVFGKGFLEGTQSHLNFLPERQTDFIFTMLAEEFGLIGALLLLGLYTMVFIYGFAIAFSCRNHFGRLLAIGITANLFFYVFINMAMVMGLIPVVGIPLPMISYGGTAMMTVLFGFGLLLSVYVNRDMKIGQRRMTEDA